MPNVLLFEVRKQILEDIAGDENRRRKNESIRRYDIYKKRQVQYIKERLIQEYSLDTVSRMRVISSINLAPRIVDKQASLYCHAPERTFATKSGAKLTEPQQDQVKALYSEDSFDEQAKKSNKFFKLQNQCCLQIIPRDGIIQTRVLQPHQYDVIPADGDPERAEGYVINVYDRSLLFNTQFVADSASGSNYLPVGYSDQINQLIADGDDSKKLTQRFIWWTAEYNFVTDGFGRIINGSDVISFQTQGDVAQITNPIGTLPFVDIASDKEYEFWVRAGNDVVDFALDFGVMLSDTAEINKLQGYAQAVVYSQEPPKDMIIGPNRVLHIQQNKDSELQPKFEFAQPGADLSGSLQLLENYISLFLTSQGMDPKMITGRGETNKFNSGFERLLAMIDLFEATADDISTYERVEQAALDLKVKWSNLMQGRTIQAPGGMRPLKPELLKSTLPEDLIVSVSYRKPEATQSKNEAEDSQIKLLENGLTTRKRAIMSIHDVDEKQAEALLEEIDEESQVRDPQTDQNDPDSPDPQNDPEMDQPA